MTGRDSCGGVLRVVALLAFLAAIAVACSSGVSDAPDPFTEEWAGMPEYPDQEIIGGEEVIDGLAEEDEFGNPPMTTEEKAGEVVTVAGYVAMIAATFVLPLLAL